jgi:hypothetical protein
MTHYDFPTTFHALYDQAVALYAKGQRGAGTFFNAADTAWLAANGLTPQHLYDYAEDQMGGGEPGYERALAIELVRRDYFINVQNSEASTAVQDEAALPPKTADVRGITWLPRLLPKARAKLRGELPASLMFCCGGDRRFFKAHDILPSEFLSQVARHIHDDEAVVEWVVSRSILAGSGT